MEAIPRKTSYLSPCLTLIVEVPDDKHPTEQISFQLKQRANSTSATPEKYKFYVQRFCEGTVQQWITVRRAFDEIWLQNALTGATDRMSTVRAILRGKSLTIFNATMEELASPTDANGVVTNRTVDIDDVARGIDAVGETVFPHRALMHQKVWMRRGMRKPKELSFRKTAAAVGRLNNSLPLFPSATVADKFSDEEIVELLECSIPQAWHTKFDLDGYTPTEHDKARLITVITECEILERNEPQKPANGLKTKDGSKDKPYKKGAVPKHKNGSKYTTDKKAGFYCTEHGTNPTHNTDACYTLKLKAKRASEPASMTKKSFRRELNLLSRKTLKNNVLDMYAAIIKTERAKCSKKKKSSPKKRKKHVEPTSDSSESSDSEDEIHVMDFKAHLKQQRRACKRKPTTTPFDNESNESTQDIDENPEEASYNKTIGKLGETRDAVDLSEGN